MDPVHPQHDANEPVIPGALRRELRGGLPDLSGLDERVMGMARQRLGRRTPRGVLARVGRVGWGLAAAASLGLAVWGGWSVWFAPVRGPESGPMASGPSSNVTILDAFALARLIERRSVDTNTSIPAAWDFDGNGTIDQRDVDAIAQRAVKISGTGRIGGGA